MFYLNVLANCQRLQISDYPPKIYYHHYHLAFSVHYTALHCTQCTGLKNEVNSELIETACRLLINSALRVFRNVDKISIFWMKIVYKIWFLQWGQRQAAGHQRQPQQDGGYGGDACPQVTQAQHKVRDPTAVQVVRSNNLNSELGIWGLRFCSTGTKGCFWAVLTIK